MKTKVGALARRGFEPNSWAGFLFATGCIAVAAGVRALLGIWFGATLYFVAFFPAVIIAALFAGLLPGLYALALSVVLGLLLFVPPQAIAGMSAPFLTNLAIYIAAGLCTVWLGHMFRSAVRELQFEQKQRELILKEVEHRARNMGALGAAIVQFTLGDDRETAHLINQRMHALQATNDLITRAPKMEPDIESIIRHELAPYDIARCTLTGGQLPLRADIARSVGLIVHELTTNAVKYGALSNGHGRIKVSWMQDREFLELSWRESGVQNGAASTRVGFGTRLIEATVKSLSGTAEREFANGDFTCRISLRIAEHR